MKLNVKRLNDKATITLGTSKSAGYDLHAVLDTPSVIINPHETLLLGTGIAIEIPNGCFGGIYARSGLALNRGLRPANCVGIIDSDYRGEVKVALHNDTEVPVEIMDNDRIAQLVIQPYFQIDIEEVMELSDTERGDNGFGSTGR